MRTLRRRSARLLSAGLAGLLLAAGATALSGGAAADTLRIDGVLASTPDLSMASSRSMSRTAGKVESSNGGTTVTGSFTLHVETKTTFEEVRLALRSPTVPGDGFDAGRQQNVVMSGRKAFTVTTTLPDGTWTAAALWSKQGRWNMGARSSFTIANGVISAVTDLPAPTGSSEIVPSPAATTAPTAAPSPEATTAPSAGPTPAPSPTTTTAPSPTPTATTAPSPTPTTAPPAPAPTLPSFTPARTAEFESGFGEWDLGGPSVQPNPGATIVRDAFSAYSGSVGARASIPAGGGNKFARTLWGNSSGQSGALNYGEGKDFTYGMALYLPVGFHANMQSYFVPMRWDNFGVTNVSRSGISMWKDGSMRLFRERAGIENQVNLLGSTEFRLSEGEWHWLEVRQKLSSRDGSALNELWVDGRLVGSSTARNYYGEPVSAIRYGIVAIADGVQTQPLTVHYDRVVLGTGRLGPR